MSDRYTFTSVCAIDDTGAQYFFYDYDCYAGGGMYKNVTTVNERQYAVYGYPMEDRVEVSGEKLPVLQPADLQSYFTDAPTDAMAQVLEIAQVAQKHFVQLVMATQYSVRSGVCEAKSYAVTAEGTEEFFYDPQDFVGDDTWSMMEHMAEEAWCQYKKHR